LQRAGNQVLAAHQPAIGNGQLVWDTQAGAASPPLLLPPAVLHASLRGAYPYPLPPAAAGLTPAGQLRTQRS